MSKKMLWVVAVAGAAWYVLFVYTRDDGLTNWQKINGAVVG